MAGDKIPTVQSLERPEKLEDILRQDRGDDCLPCKVIGKFFQQMRPEQQQQQQQQHRTGPNFDLGSGAFFGLAAYSYFSGMSQLERQRALILKSNSMFGMRSRKLGIASISAGIFWMGLWRAFK
jgi:hypothetical protein